MLVRQSFFVCKIYQQINTDTEWYQTGYTNIENREFSIYIYTNLMDSKMWSEQ